jgi:hypothetical protein
MKKMDTYFLTPTIQRTETEGQEGEAGGGQGEK